MVVSAHVLKRDRFGAGEVQITARTLGLKENGGTGHAEDCLLLMVRAEGMSCTLGKFKEFSGKNIDSM